MQLVHTDICGPMKTQSLGGSIYFLTFIDDFSRNIWIYFLKQKSEAFEKFKELKTLVEKQSGLYINVLGSDRGGEFSSNEFLEFYTTRYTPQQNGVAKRNNKTIMEMERSVLKTKKLSNDFWAEAVACVVYILNKSPTKSVQNKIPHETWKGKKHNVFHFRVFRCVCYSLVPYELRRKLDDKIEKCIFIGYSEESKAYKLYNLVSKKLMIRRDVKLEEEDSWHGNDNKQVTRGPPILQIDDELKEQGTQTPPNTPPRNFVQATSPPSSNVSVESDATFSKPRYKGKKTKSLKEIYDQEEKNVDIY